MGDLYFSRTDQNISVWAIQLDGMNAKDVADFINSHSKSTARPQIEMGGRVSYEADGQRAVIECGWWVLHAEEFGFLHAAPSVFLQHWDQS